MSHAIIDHQAECQEPLDAICRQVWDCDCEWFNGMDGPLPDGTWTHESHQWDDDLDEPVLHRSHLQTPVEGKRLWCNIVEWIDCQGMWDCWTSAEAWGSRVPDPFTRDYPTYLPDGPITYEWGDEWLEWDYEGMPPALGAFIARQVVGRWAESLGLD